MMNVNYREKIESHGGRNIMLIFGMEEVCVAEHWKAPVSALATKLQYCDLYHFCVLM